MQLESSQHYPPRIPTWPHIELDIPPCPSPLPEYVPPPSMLDQCVSRLDLPEELDFHTPPRGMDPREFPVEIFADVKHVWTCPIEVLCLSPNHTYNLLLKWCMTQSYWFYILGRRQVHDQEFDTIKAMILHMEQNFGFEIDEDIQATRYPHTYSPTKMTVTNNQGQRKTCNPCLWNQTYYPQYLQDLFRWFPLNPQDPGQIDFDRRVARAQLYQPQMETSSFSRFHTDGLVHSFAPPKSKPQFVKRTSIPIQPPPPLEKPP